MDSERTKLPSAHNTLFFMWLSTLTSAYHQQFHTTTYFSFVIMSSFLLKKKHKALLFCFNLKKSAADRIECLWRPMATMLYRKQRAEISFACLKTRRQLILMRDKKRENRPRKVEDSQLQALLDEDDTQSQKILAEQLGVSQAAISMWLHVVGKVQKIGKWVPHELNDRQMERRQNTCQILLVRQKKVIPASDCDRQWKVDLFSESYTQEILGWSPTSTSSSRPNRFGRRCCAFDGIRRISYYYELLKSGEIVNVHHYYQLIKLHRALREKRLHYRKRHDKLIFLHDNALSHTSTMVQNYLETLNWEVPSRSSDLTLSDYHLFSSMDHALVERHFDSYEDVRKWLDELFASKNE